MNRISQNGFGLIAFLTSFFATASIAIAGNGHVDRVVDVAVESISSDGLKQIKYLDLARKHLILNFGLDAENWPIMVDLANHRVLFSGQVREQLSEILFKDL